MQGPPYSLDNQYKILNEDKVPEIVQKHLGGDTRRIGELITLTQEEYLAWVLTKPLKLGWVRTTPSTQDGVYFLERGKSWWTIYQQERGGIEWQESFDSYEKARRYLEIDNGLGRFLQRENEVKTGASTVVETQSTLRPDMRGEHKAEKKWWQFW